MNGDDLNNLKTDVQIIKRDISSIETFSVKIDEAIEKITEVSNSISKMLIVHEHKLQNHDQMIDGIRLAMSERKNDFDKQVDELNRRISDMTETNHKEREKHHREVMDAIKGIANDQKQLDDRVGTLEAWKWYLMGAGGVVGFLLTFLPWDKFFGG